MSQPIKASEAKKIMELMQLPRRERRRIMKLNPGMRIPGANFPLVKARKPSLDDLR